MKGGNFRRLCVRASWAGCWGEKSGNNRSPVDERSDRPDVDTSPLIILRDKQFRRHRSANGCR
jgi:hypothetical protein